jgi:hypothetical protein
MNLLEKLKDRGISTTVTDQEGVTIELEDIMTGRNIAVAKGENLEDAYANLFTALASSVRRSKNQIAEPVDYNRLTRL